MARSEPRAGGGPSPTGAPFRWTRWIRGLRGIAFVGLAAFILLGPAARQVFGRRHPAFRAWVMFSGIALHLVEVDYTQRLPDGTSRPVDRFEVLGVDRRKAPRSIRRIVRRREFDRMNRRLCGKLGPGADLRARARIATKKGWKILADGDRNVCERGGRRRR